MTRERDTMIILYYTKIKIPAQVGFLTNLSLMTNTATLSPSNIQREREKGKQTDRDNEQID